MESREEHLSELKKQHETVEDEVFLTFCQQVKYYICWQIVLSKKILFFYKIGVPNIRAYEEKELHKQQENSKRRLEFENQHSRLTNLLEYEQVI